MLDRPDFRWTDEAVEELKKHWLDGLSCSLIAAEMGHGLTRNSIIGKVTRLKLPKRTQTLSKAAQSASGRAARFAAKPSPARACRRPPTPPASEPEPFDAETDIGIDVTKRVGIMDLTSHTCRWPVGAATGARQMFCGCHADLIATGPYCPEHTDRAENRR